MAIVALVDVDNTLAIGDEFIPGALEKVNDMVAKGYEIWLFTCRPPNGEWVGVLVNKGLRFHGIIHKPFSEQGYLWFDDKMISASTKLI